MPLSFDHVIEELSIEIGIPLSLDSKGNAVLLVQSKLNVIIEPDRYDDFIILESYLPPLPPGAYRAALLEEALIYNNQVFPSGPVIGYIPGKTQLVLFQKFPLVEFHAKELAAALVQLAQIGLQWKEGIEEGKKEFVIRKKASNPLLMGKHL